MSRRESACSSRRHPTPTPNPDPHPHQVTLLEVEGDHKLMSLGPDGEVLHSTERLTLSLLRASTLPSYHP